ncbi:hypothetical protein TcCL_Unassigned00291 [Trypanosoma cruzi]|nr:hypothetical protein TcCL_Unassigned00291 [Trypanosoma cruzi]
MLARATFSPCIPVSRPQEGEQGDCVHVRVDGHVQNSSRFKEIRHAERPRPQIGSSLKHRSRNSKRPLVAFLRSRFIIITPPQQRVPASGGDDCSIAPRVGGAHNVSLRPRAVSNKPHDRTQHNSPTRQ